MWIAGGGSWSLQALPPDSGLEAAAHPSPRSRGGCPAHSGLAPLLPPPLPPASLHPLFCCLCSVPLGPLSLWMWVLSVWRLAPPGREPLINSGRKPGPWFTAGVLAAWIEMTPRGFHSLLPPHPGCSQGRGQRPGGILNSACCRVGCGLGWTGHHLPHLALCLQAALCLSCSRLRDILCPHLSVVAVSTHGPLFITEGFQTR